MIAFLQQYQKAIVALIVPALVETLGNVGFKADPGFVDALTVILTGFFVWLVPNKPAE